MKASLHKQYEFIREKLLKYELELTREEETPDDPINEAQRLLETFDGDRDQEEIDQVFRIEFSQLLEAS
jgi:hypothetical protein